MAIDIEIFGVLGRNDGGINRDKIVQSIQVDGGYFPCAEVPTSGTWQVGQLCYCTGTTGTEDYANKFYQYTKEGKWEVKVFAASTLSLTTGEVDTALKAVFSANTAE